MNDIMNALKHPTRMTVLVVEDEPLVRIFMADFLEEAGFKVFEAVNADEAITVLEARRDVQAVVTDIEMPGSMDGLALVKVLRERWPGIRIVVTSGRKRPGSGDLSEGVAFLAKPYLPETVIQMIEQASTPQMTEDRAGASWYPSGGFAQCLGSRLEERPHDLRRP
jgi:CheY-like chemotaxis protein